MYGAIWIIITRSPVTLDFQLIFIEFRVEFVTEKFNKNQLKVEEYITYNRIQLGFNGSSEAFVTS